MSKLFYSFTWTIICGLLLSFNKPGPLPAKPPIDLTDIEYHQQETNVYCGAACAQMILHQIGVPHTANLCDDINLCKNNTELCQGCQKVMKHQHISGWKTGTHTRMDYRIHLIITARQNLQPISGLPFFEETDKAVITQKIVWTIFNYKVAPIVLVYSNRVNNGLHWIVVKGYESSSNPVTSDDPDFNINDISGFWIYDPLPQVPAPPPPRHLTNDVCGSGIDENGLNRGSAYQFVPLDEWISSYLVSVSDGHWKNKMLAICDPDRGPHKGKRIYQDTALFSGEQIIKPKIAKMLAVKSLKNLGIEDKEYLPAQLKSPKAGNPLLVQRIDRDSDYYYIVPLLGTDDKNHGVVDIDARFGKYKQLSFPKNNGYAMKYKTFSKPEIVAKLNSFLEMKFKKDISLSSKAIIILPNWIWMPCKESLSPFYPFQVVVYNYKLFYIRIDGQVFDKLSTDGKGM